MYDDKDKKKSVKLKKKFFGIHFFNYVDEN